ncbi:nucleotide 5'-monophosphate nucleosidase PpnN [Teredinibacter franksiae]|uniref:nucleotide 5'-monophosphate nucleosidase PpnN n=1 Tax=Teredinibacter franksiae TaxID=2761453 RepID=UPI0016282DC8|nr:nucleotide 5'-monophosphate nucleosidase PpnN [Teredinibacter franksiae]
MSEEKNSVLVSPDNTLNVLSQQEVAGLIDRSNVDVYETFRRCALAALNTGSETDNTKEVLDTFSDFSVDVVQQERGIKLRIENAPANAFVDGEMIQGIKEHLFSALRDIIYVNNELLENCDTDFSSSEGITNGVFHILRNSELLHTNTPPNIIVCWGGHAIGEEEYDYAKEVGYQLGLRGMDICTGCGPGAMKGPMKGATFGHAKQRLTGRYIGITEPGIIAAEAPNPIVNELVIMPDIEKRLEAFVRTGHGIVVFPGGVGTAEEILYILGILLHPENKRLPFPLIFSGPDSSADYFNQIDNFIGAALGSEAQQRYDIVLGDPVEVARKMRLGMAEVTAYRQLTHDAYYFNWVIKIEQDFQEPFRPTHEAMAALKLHKQQPVNELASNLRRAFSGIVDGNVKEHGIKAVAEKGPYEIHGDAEIIAPLDALLRSFVSQKRMKIPTTHYIPCYRIVQ